MTKQKLTEILEKCGRKAGKPIFNMMEKYFGVIYVGTILGAMAIMPVASLMVPPLRQASNPDYIEYVGCGRGGRIYSVVENFPPRRKDKCDMPTKDTTHHYVIDSNFDYYPDKDINISHLEEKIFSDEEASIGGE